MGFIASALWGVKCLLLLNNGLVFNNLCLKSFLFVMGLFWHGQKLLLIFPFLTYLHFFVLLLKHAYDCPFDILLTWFPLLNQSFNESFTLLKPLYVTICKFFLDRSFGRAHLDWTKTYFIMQKMWFWMSVLSPDFLFSLGFMFVFRKNPLYLLFLLEFKIRSLFSKTKDEWRRKSFSYPFQSLFGNFKERIIWQKFSFFKWKCLWLLAVVAVSFPCQEFQFSLAHSIGKMTPEVMVSWWW